MPGSPGGVDEKYCFRGPNPEPPNQVLGISSDPYLAFSLSSQPSRGSRAAVQRGFTATLLISSKTRTFWGGDGEEVDQ